MNSKKMGKRQSPFFVIIGPSGVGKTSLVHALINNEQGCMVQWIPTFTSRAPRPGEIEGVNYFFVSEERFKQMIAEGALVEWSQAYRAFYGIGREKIREAREKDGVSIAVMDRFGAVAVKREMPDTHVILIVPPSREKLEQRLRGRNADTAEKIAFRLQQADQEDQMEKDMPIADHVIVNDIYEKAVEELRALVCFSK